MLQKLKALGLALVMALTMSAFMVAIAHAAPMFTSSVSPVSVHGTGEGVNERLTIDGVTLNFKVSHYTGTVTNGSSTLTLNPTYTETELAGTGLKGSTATNGCGYLFHLTSKSGVTYNSTMDIECPAGNVIIFTGISTHCILHIGAQTGLTTVNWTNDATDVTFKRNVSGIKGTVVNDPFLCPFNGTGPKTGGTYVTDGYITLTAASGTLQISGE